MKRMTHRYLLPIYLVLAFSGAAYTWAYYAALYAVVSERYIVIYDMLFEYASKPLLSFGAFACVGYCLTAGFSGTLSSRVRRWLFGVSIGFLLAYLILMGMSFAGAFGYPVCYFLFELFSEPAFFGAAGLFFALGVHAKAENP